MILKHLWIINNQQSTINNQQSTITEYTAKPVSNESENIKSPFILHINGFSYHFKKNNQNEENYGAGFSYGFEPLKSEFYLLNNTRFLVEFDAYRDSYNNFAYSTGLIWQRHMVSTFDWGLRAGLVHEDGIQSRSHLYLFPYILPFVESRFDFPVNLRATIIPPLGTITNGLVVFQLMIDI